jgi:hypothetical protein
MARRCDNSLTRALLPATLTLIFVGLVALVFRVGAQGQPPAPAQSASESGTPPPQIGSTLQPLAFSHRLHVRERTIPCLTCHTYARRGPVAGIPSVQRCAQCHLTIAKERPEIVKLLKYWEDKEPIPWLRVHDLPDYVRFTHKRHVLAGVTCQTCHGDVAGMDAAIQTAPLTMGWCLSCHKERQAPTECLTCHH